MTSEEFNSKWDEGLDALNQMGVCLERAHHSLNVMEQRLDELDALESKPRGIFGLFNYKENK